MKVLIAGIGIVGKSTLRRKFVGRLRLLGLPAVHCDADRFGELRHAADLDCASGIPEGLSGDTICIVEDVRGTTERSAIPIADFDLILYVRAGILSHLMFWLPRVTAWFCRGQFAYDRQGGWKGTGLPYDPRNIPPILGELYRLFRKRREWIKEDLEVISKLPHVIVRSVWTPDGPKFELDI